MNPLDMMLIQLTLGIPADLLRLLGSSMGLHPDEDNIASILFFDMLRNVISIHSKAFNRVDQDLGGITVSDNGPCDMTSALSQWPVGS